MNLEAVWHDLECGGYTEDLELWHGLASKTGGPVLDVGAGTGRVALELATRGVPVLALDVAAPLLAALACRARGLPVETVLADAREFCLDRRFQLIAVPMQTLQLFGGRAGRAAFLRCALEHLEPGGILAAALADAVDCFDSEHDLPPAPDACEILGVRYASQLLGVVDEGGRAAIHRRREIVGGHDHCLAQDVVVHLDRVSPDEVAAEALGLGFTCEPQLYVPESEQYLGSTVVVLKAPSTPRAPRQPEDPRRVTAGARIAPESARAGERLQYVTTRQAATAPAQTRLRGRDSKFPIPEVSQNDVHRICLAAR